MLASTATLIKILSTGDRIDTGLFGINQHWGYDAAINRVGNASAGCLVGRSRASHREFMNLIKQDVRYKKDPSFIFTTTIIPGDELVRVIPGDSDYRYYAQNHLNKRLKAD